MLIFSIEEKGMAEEKIDTYQDRKERTIEYKVFGEQQKIGEPRVYKILEEQLEIRLE